MTTWRRDVSLVLVLLLIGTIYVVAERWQREPGTRDDAIAAHAPTCTLLTSAEIESVLGSPTSAGKQVGADPDDAAGTRSGTEFDDGCFWPAGNVETGPDEGRSIGVDLDFVDLASYDAYGAEVGGPHLGETVRPITVGEHEGLVVSSGTQRSVLARSGRHVLQLSASLGPSGPWRVEAAVELTRLALSRIDA